MERLAALQILVKVIDTGSFSAAGRQLNLGQPSVSKAVAQLERRLGVPLILRSSRKLTPTEAGREFYRHAKRAIEEAVEAEAAARGAGGSLAGVLKFAAPPTFARLHIVPHLPEFLGQHPALRIDAVLDDRRTHLIEEGIDVAFRVGTPEDSSVVARRIGRSRSLVVGSPRYFMRAGRPGQPRDLTQHRALVYCGTRLFNSWTFRKGTRKEAVSLTDVFRATSIEALREAALAGLGLFITTEWVVHTALRAGALETALDDWTLPAFDMHAVFPGGRRTSAKARAFTRFIESQLRASGFNPP